MGFNVEIVDHDADRTDAGLTELVRHQTQGLPRGSMRTDDQNGSVDDARDDDRIGHGERGRGVEDDVIVPRVEERGSHPIEERRVEELRRIRGYRSAGQRGSVRLP